jgi:Macrocin-O-methyltransferase (TylF)
MTNELADEQLLPHESPRQADVRHQLGRLLQAAPFPPEEQVDNLPLFLRLQPLTDMLSIDALYRMVLDVPGVIMEFGVHRGRHMALFTALRGVYEPYNPHRRVIGFDTFEGFPEVAAIDELGHSAVPGKFTLPNGYINYLRAALSAHEANEPLGHIRRTIVVEGDVRETLPAYLQANPQTVIALAYFDLDLYEPTLAALRAIRPYLVRGSVVAFDEINHAKWPGETAALRDAWAQDRNRLQHFPSRATPAFMQID